MFASPGETIFQIGDFQVRWYGFLIAIAFLVCAYIAGELAKKRYEGIEENDLSNFAIVTILSGLVGARAWFVFLNLEYFMRFPSEVVQIWLGGQSIQGGILGAVLGTLIFTYLNFSNGKTEIKDKLLKIKAESLSKIYLVFLSIAATVLPLGQAIGRWGNFFNEEAYGSKTSLPWALYVKSSDSFHHPTFLYESIACLGLFFLMLKLYEKFRPLQSIGFYLFSYSVIRLLIEPIRTDSLYIGDIKAASLVSYFMLLIAVALFSIDRLKTSK